MEPFVLIRRSFVYKVAEEFPTRRIIRKSQVLNVVAIAHHQKLVYKLFIRQHFPYNF